MHRSVKPLKMVRPWKGYISGTIRQKNSKGHSSNPFSKCFFTLFLALPKLLGLQRPASLTKGFLEKKSVQ